MFDFNNVPLSPDESKIDELAVYMNVSYACAADIVFFRSQPYYSEEKEAELVNLHACGNPPNMSSFGKL